MDRDLFVPPTPAERVQVRADLSVPEHAQLFVYLGSIGTWYMLDEMLDCFAVARGRDPRSVLLFVTRDEPGPILAAAAARGVPEAALRIVPATRAEVPALAGSADAGLFFIRPTFSKLGSSPTKLGELLALGVPVLTNPGVGDVDRILGECGAGVTVSGFAPHAYAEALDRLSALRPDPARREQAVARWFDLDEGVRRYDSIYRQLAAKAAVGNARPAS